jgi:hypothetical protein
MKYLVITVSFLVLSCSSGFSSKTNLQIKTQAQESEPNEYFETHKTIATHAYSMRSQDELDTLEDLGKKGEPIVYDATMDAAVARIVKDGHYSPKLKFPL